MFEVYCHTSPSGKRYVGYSRDGMAKRWSEHVQETRSGSDRLVCRAIRKHGAGSFKHELLAQCDTEAGAHASERYWIRVRNTLAPAGYNATTGGDGGERSEPTLEKLRASWTPERRAHHSELMQGHTAGNTFGTANRGRKASEEKRAKMRESALSMAPEVRAKIDAARAASKASRPPVKYSAESRARMSEAQRKRWAENRPRKVKQAGP